MLGLAEIINHTRGVLRLLRFDPAGAAYFDNTLEAFWRSFRVLILIAPAYILIRVIDYQNVTTPADGAEIVLLEALEYVVQAFLFPVVMYEVARLADLQRNYLRYIAALNWINVPWIAIAFVVIVIWTWLPMFRTGFAIGQELLYFIWFYSTTRLVLGASWGLTVGLFLFDRTASLLLGLFLQRALEIVPT